MIRKGERKDKKGRSFLSMPLEITDTHEHVTGYVKVSKAWLHIFGGLLVTQIATIITIGISMYIDIRIIKKDISGMEDKMYDQRIAIENLQHAFIYGEMPDRLNKTINRNKRNHN